MSIEAWMILGVLGMITFAFAYLSVKISNINDELVRLNNKMNYLSCCIDRVNRDTDQMMLKWFNVSRNMNEIKDCVECIEECLSDITDALEEEEEEDLDIHMITREEFYCERGEYMHQHLVYNEEKEIVHLEGNEDIVFEEYPALIGDGLRFFGVHGKEPHIIYIRNEKFKCDFEVTRIYAKKV